MANSLELHDLSHGREAGSSRRESDESTLYDHEYDEPLLDQEALRPAKRQVTPLPKAQLAALCTVRLVDPIAFTQGVSDDPLFLRSALIWLHL